MKKTKNNRLTLDLKSHQKLRLMPQLIRDLTDVTGGTGQGFSNNRGCSVAVLCSPQ